MAYLRARFGFALVVGLGLLLAGCRADPKDPQYWVKELQAAKRPQDKVRVLDELRKSESLSKAFLPMLHEQLASQKAPEAKAAIVKVLTQLKDPSSVEPLVEAVDLTATGSAADRLNREVATALGDLGDAKGIQPLLKLLGSRDPFVQLQAAEALGKLKAKPAVTDLLALAQDDSKEAPVANRAITALGMIGDPSVVPTLIRLMFEQRGSASLYDSAAFALYKIGKPSADALLPVLAGSDEKLNAWARKHEVSQAALFSKAAQVLGYLLEPRAEPLLLQRLAFKSDDEALQAYVRLTAADSLGRLRSKAALKPLAAALGEPELMVRGSYLRALGRIGSRESVPALLQSSGQGLWELRAPALDALGLVGDGHEVAAVEQLAAGEAARVQAECAEADGPEGRLCKDLQGLTQKRAQLYQEHVAQLKAGDRCADNMACWTQALEDANASVRTRAALTLGRSGKAEHVVAVLKKMNDSNQETRLALIQAADWLTEGNAEAVRAAKGQLAALDGQLTLDEGKADWVEPSDNLKRLVAKLRRSE